MMLTLGLQGIAIGLSIAAPVGPIGILCMNRTIVQGRLFGFVSGLGAATADGLYGVIAALGFTVIMKPLMDYASWIGLIGGLFLIYLGYQAFRSKPAQGNSNTSGSLLGAYLTVFALTVTNPMTVMSFLGIFAGLSPVEGNVGSSLILVLGIFIGSMLWWLTLSNIVGLVRKAITNQAMQWINRGSGAVLIVFGVVAIIR
ncbi:LysE family translocator [Paenibacillus kobensis]|uniref:LysE family translocator n=1 Tax=Paenibacillus kobensis TaxID=59841 RepID=UPI000FD9ABE2|nr:LysE family translocator [Paenibacillus kobensis]